MEGERVGGEIEFVRDSARRHAVGPGLHKQPEDRQAMILRKRGKSGDGV